MSSNAKKGSCVCCHLRLTQRVTPLALIYYDCTERHCIPVDAPIEQPSSSHTHSTTLTYIITSHRSMTTPLYS